MFKKTTHKYTLICALNFLFFFVLENNNNIKELPLVHIHSLLIYCQIIDDVAEILIDPFKDIF